MNTPGGPAATRPPRRAPAAKPSRLRATWLRRDRLVRPVVSEPVGAGDGAGPDRGDRETGGPAPSLQSCSLRAVERGARRRVQLPAWCSSTMNASKSGTRRGRRGPDRARREEELHADGEVGGVEQGAMPLATSAVDPRAALRSTPWCRRPTGMPGLDQPRRCWRRPRRGR